MCPLYEWSNDEDDRTSRTALRCTALQQDPISVWNDWSCGLGYCIQCTAIWIIPLCFCHAVYRWHSSDNHSADNKLNCEHLLNLTKHTNETTTRKHVQSHTWKHTHFTYKCAKCLALMISRLYFSLQRPISLIIHRTCTIEKLDTLCFWLIKYNTSIGTRCILSQYMLHNIKIKPPCFLCYIRE